MKKIGFCFLIYDEIYNKKLWKRFFEGIPKNQYGIYIHSKKNFDNPFDNSKTYVNVIETEWGKISLVQATHVLFREAYLDKCDYLLLLSGDTIPVGKFNYIKIRLNSSIFSVQPKELITVKQNKLNNKVYNKMGNYIKNNISFNSFKKQNMFFGITKKDYEIIYDHRKKMCFFKNCFAPDEYYFINMFNLLKLKYTNNFIYVNSKSKTITQAMLFKYDEINYDSIKKENYLFIRKIRKIPSNYAIKYLF